MSPTRSMLFAGSMIWPLVMRVVFIKSVLCAVSSFSLGIRARAEVKHGHADGEAVGHLVEDDAAAAVGEVAVDLDAAVDRAGVHDERTGLEVLGTLLGEAEERGVFAEAGEVFLALPLVLDAQQVDDVDFGQHGIK